MDAPQNYILSMVFSWHISQTVCLSGTRQITGTVICVVTVHLASRIAVFSVMPRGDACKEMV